MADDGLPAGAPNGFKYITPSGAAAASTPSGAAPASTGAPSGYRPATPSAPVTTAPPADAVQPAPPPPPPPAANPPTQDDGGWLHWLATKGLGQDYQRSIEKGMTAGLGDAITGGIMGLGKAAVTGDTSAISDEIARQRADTASARERIGPTGQAATDIVSQFMPVQRALGSVPYVGPIVQGGVQGATNAYGEGKSWSDIKNDALAGGASGAGSMLFNPTVLRAAFKYGPPAAVIGGVGHAYLPEFHGGWAGAALSPFVGNERLDKVTDWGADKVASLVSNPAARQAIQNLIIGGAPSASNTDTGKTVTQNLTNALPSVDLNTAGTALQNLRRMLPF